MLTLGLIAVAVSALLPWLRQFATFPEEPIDVAVIYRDVAVGDVQYFPLISQLARGTITDGSVKELDGAYLRSFPHATILPHALCVAVFGAYGFVVADVLVTVCYFLLLVAIFHLFRVPLPLGTVVACALALQLPILKTWGARIPRPFVSELYLLAILATTIQMLTVSRATIVHWLLLAASFALVIQGDIHAAIIFALLSPWVIYSVGRRDGIGITVPNGVAAGFLFVAMLTPFLLQRLYEHPDIPIRWGVFEIDRLDGLATYFYFLKLNYVIAFVCFTALWLRSHKTFLEQGDPIAETFGQTRWLVVALCLTAITCIPVSILILGKSIQPYHFNDRAKRIFSYLAIILLMTWIAVLSKRAPTSLPVSIAWLRQRVASWRPWGVLALIFFVRGVIVFAGTLPDRPVRHAYYPHTRDVQPTYRAAFSELTAFMERRIPADAVVASFDHQLISWWLTFHEGHWFLVEPFVSNIPDDELEIRISLLCRLVGMSANEFSDFLQTPDPCRNGYVNTFWFGLGKYQASQVHTFSKLDDYTKAQQAAILGKGDVWQKMISQSELVRLTNRYSELSLSELETRTLDVIVLSTTGPEGPFSPPKGDWTLAFQNDGFRLFIRVEE